MKSGRLHLKSARNLADFTWNLLDFMKSTWNLHKIHRISWNPHEIRRISWMWAFGWSPSIGLSFERPNINPRLDGILAHWPGKPMSVNDKLLDPPLHPYSNPGFISFFHICLHLNWWLLMCMLRLWAKGYFYAELTVNCTILLLLALVLNYPLNRKRQYISNLFCRTLPVHITLKPTMHRHFCQMHVKRLFTMYWLIN